MKGRARWWLQMVTINLKGMTAFREGKSLDDNPYRGRSNFQRGRYRAWEEGYLRARYDDGNYEEIGMKMSQVDLIVSHLIERDDGTGSYCEDDVSLCRFVRDELDIDLTLKAAGVVRRDWERRRQEISTKES